MKWRADGADRPGYAVAAVLMLAFTVINLYGANRLSHANTAVVWWKIAIPVLTIVPS